MDDARTSTIDAPGSGMSRRRFLLGGLGLGAVATAGALGLDFFFDSGLASADTSGTYALPSTTAPEQLHLTWGADPTTSMNVSWGSPGSTPQPAPSIVYSTSPITAANPGTSVPVSVRSFTDGLNLQAVYYYHAPLTGLAPATTYFYQVSDGASPVSTAGGSFATAPSGRSKYTFTSYGDLGTPRSANLSSSGHSWAESSDNAYYAVGAVEGATPLFHLLNGDLCYANLNTNNQPGVWRDFGNNVARSAANRPWMPCLGNHEIEFGATNQDGSTNSSGNGGYNGAYGYGPYMTRFNLPDNGVAGYHGNFYSFQVGTVLFISLDADDVIYQDGGAYTLTAINSTASSSNPYPPNNTNINIPAGTSVYNNQYTGALASGPNDTLVPSGSTPNAQTMWLASTLANARSSSSTVDMIVVQMHQCALSSSSSGNGSDLGIRQAWLPLFDQYGVDLVVSGHEHNYERSFAVRGYDTSYYGQVVNPNPGQTSGSTVLTRRPTVQSAAGPLADPANATIPAFDTTKGTVFLVLGGGGTDGPTNKYGTDTANNLPQAKVITTRNLIYKNSSGSYVKNGADSVEDAPWSAKTDAADAYGFATFQVDPGAGPGQTSILMTYQHAPQVGPSFTGTTTYSTYEQVLFGHNLPATPYTPPAALPEIPTPALAAGAAAVVGGAAIAISQRRKHAAEAEGSEA